MTNPIYTPAEHDAALFEDSSFVKGLRLTKVFVWVAWAYFVFVVVVLTFAFLLLLLNANPEASFVAWVYRSSERAMEPFRGMFPAETSGAGSVVDFSILFAVLVYGIVALAVQILVSWIDRKIREERAKARVEEAELARRRALARQTAAQQVASQPTTVQHAQQVASQPTTVQHAQQVASQPTTVQHAQQVAGYAQPYPDQAGGYEQPHAPR